MDKFNINFKTKNEQLTFHHIFTDTPLNNDFKIHTHNYYELYYFISGNVTFYVEGQNYNINSGDLLIINSKELHRTYINSSSSYERIFLHCKPEYAYYLNTDEYDLFYCFEKRKLGYFNRIEKSDVLKYGINKYIKDIEYYFNENSEESEVLIFTIFVQLLVKLNKIYLSKNNLITNSLEDDSSKKIQEILNYINENLSKKITLNILQEEFYINKYYLCHLFKKSTGFTIQEYIIYKRLMKAKELLLLKTPVLEVSSLVGFGDYSNFYRVFKKVFGDSPRNFLK
jgi:AraC-like DNA-binding protein